MASIKGTIIKRAIFSFICLLIFAIVLLYYIVKIQFIEGKTWRALSDSATLREKEILAVRGNIFSDDGTLLATSIPKYDIAFDATSPHKDSFNKYISLLAVKFSNYFKDKPAEEYKSIFIKARTEKKRYLLLKRKLNYLEVKMLKSWPIFSLGKYKGGLILEEENERLLPFGNLASRTIGYKRETTQSVGIEAYYDKLLSGISGKRLMQKIAGGYRAINDEEELRPENGKDVYTTLNVNFQDIAHKALENGLIKHQADHGCAIVMEVKTGQIKAIANLSADGLGNYKESFNYAVGESYEPGSTFKLISTLAMLETEKLDTGDTVLINYGKYNIGGKEMIDAEISGHKQMPFSYAFEHSSNVGISTSMIKYFKDEPQKFIDYCKTLNLHKITNIELPGEAKPFLREANDPKWSKTSLPWMSIGYEVRITPLQLLNIYNGIANNGKLLKPYIVRGLGKSGDFDQQFEPKVINDDMCNANTLKQIKKMLSAVVTKGTATSISKSKVSIAGKTGTARIAQGNRYLEGAYNASFAGYFPADNPKYSCIVVVNKPTVGGYFGGVVAAPIFKEIAEKVSGYSYSNIVQLPDSIKVEQTMPKIIAGNTNEIKSIIDRLTKVDYDNEGDKTEYSIFEFDNKESYTYKSIESAKNTMPNLIGMGLKDVIYITNNLGLAVQIKGRGKVKKQSIKYGDAITKGNKLYIELEL